MAKRSNSGEPDLTGPDRLDDLLNEVPASGVEPALLPLCRLARKFGHEPPALTILRGMLDNFHITSNDGRVILGGSIRSSFGKTGVTGGFWGFCRENGDCWSTPVPPDSLLIQTR